MLMLLLLFARGPDEVTEMGVIVYCASSAGMAVVVPQTFVCASESRCLFFCCLYILILICIPSTSWGYS